jgi:hypothetical protein
MAERIGSFVVAKWMEMEKRGNEDGELRIPRP